MFLMPTQAMFTVGSGGFPLPIFADRQWVGGCTGQFYDMIHMLGLTGGPSDKHCLLMNGDLVDRGSWSVEVILTAFAFKCTFTPHVIVRTVGCS